ncbi:hypothetical protein ABZ353_10740 [Streptomyces niveus]|uniref:hypothetical protein n=1 Tax=Streptomyces niveus TaxID=193462 RepID=UPI0033DFF08B
MPELDDELDYEFWTTTQRPSKAAQRREGRLAVQEELDDFADLYELPEGLQIPGVKA